MSLSALKTPVFQGATLSPTVLCANYFRILILRLTQADLMTGSMHLKPLRIINMDRNIGNA
jgi:hypothetical protein